MSLYSELVHFTERWGDLDVEEIDQLELWEELKSILSRHRPAPALPEDRVTNTEDQAASFERGRACFDDHDLRYGPGAPSRAEAEADRP